MRRYLLDTGILVHYVRQSAKYYQIEQAEKLTDPDCLPLISVVTHGEILSFAIQNNWGPQKLQVIRNLLTKLIVLDINSTDTALLDEYAAIDSFSKNKLRGNPLGSSVKMGKNDIWIAATARVSNAILLTTDGDFDHLIGTFIPVRKY